MAKIGSKPKSDYAIQTVMNAFRMLEVFDGAVAIGVSDVARSLGLHKNNAFRLLATLEIAGYIQQSADNELYHLGPALPRARPRLRAQSSLCEPRAPGARGAGGRDGRDGASRHPARSGGGASRWRLAESAPADGLARRVSGSRRIARRSGRRSSSARSRGRSPRRLSRRLSRREGASRTAVAAGRCPSPRRASASGSSSASPTRRSSTERSSSTRSAPARCAATPATSRNLRRVFTAWRRRCTMPASGSSRRSRFRGRASA